MLEGAMRPFCSRISLRWANKSGDASTFTASTLEIRAALIASIISSGLLIGCTAS